MQTGLLKMRVSSTVCNERELCALWSPKGYGSDELKGGRGELEWRYLDDISDAGDECQRRH